MIQAKELRIGNAILRRGFLLEDSCFVGKIVEPSDIEACNRCPSDFNPVILTEEILIKAGFTLLNFDSFEYDGYKILSVKCGKFRLFAYSTNNYSTVENDGLGIKISILHKLQNFYFEMENEELQINL